MGTEQNKAVVRRTTDEVLAGGNLSLADELLAPDFKGPEFSDTDRRLQGGDNRPQGWL